MKLADILLYGLILVAKVIEVSIATMRIMLITKGERLVGAILGFFEVMIWVMIVRKECSTRDRCFGRNFGFRSYVYYYMEEEISGSFVCR